MEGTKMCEYIIEEYDTKKTIVNTKDLAVLIETINKLRDDGLSNYRISEVEEVDGEEFPTLCMNLEEFDEIAYLKCTI